MLEPGGLHVLEQPFSTTFAAISALAISAKAASCVEQICAIYPYDARLELRRHLQRHVDVLAPHARCQAIDRIIGQLNRFLGSAESHRCENRAEDFLLRDDRRRMHIAQKSRGEIETPRGQHNLRLPAGRAIRHALCHHAFDAIQLHARDDGADIDRLIERGSDAQGAHALANLGHQRLRDALLHEQARTRAAHLSLVEPDSIDETFDRAVEVGIFEDDERRFPTQFERKAFVACGGRVANRASHFGRPSERNLIDIRMPHQRLAGRPVSGNDVDDSGGQCRFLA